MGGSINILHARIWILKSVFFWILKPSILACIVAPLFFLYCVSVCVDFRFYLFVVVMKSLQVGRFWKRCSLKVIRYGAKLLHMITQHIIILSFLSVFLCQVYWIDLCCWICHFILSRLLLFLQSLLPSLISLYCCFWMECIQNKSQLLVQSFGR